MVGSATADNGILFSPYFTKQPSLLYPLKQKALVSIDVHQEKRHSGQHSVIERDVAGKRATEKGWIGCVLQKDKQLWSGSGKGLECYLIEGSLSPVKYFLLILR